MIDDGLYGDLSTESLRLASDIREAFGAVCDLRERSTGELKAKLSLAAAALYDATREAQDAARD